MYLIQYFTNKNLGLIQKIVSELDIQHYDAIEKERQTIDPQLISSFDRKIETLPEKIRLITKEILLIGKI